MLAAETLTNGPGAYARGLEPLMTTYSLLDISPFGRNERGLSYTMEWVRHHDRYEDQD